MIQRKEMNILAKHIIIIIFLSWVGYKRAGQDSELLLRETLRVGDSMILLSGRISRARGKITGRAYT